MRLVSLSEASIQLRSSLAKICQHFVKISRSGEASTVEGSGPPRDAHSAAPAGTLSRILSTRSTPTGGGCQTDQASMHFYKKLTAENEPSKVCQSKHAIPNPGHKYRSACVKIFRSVQCADARSTQNFRRPHLGLDWNSCEVFKNRR